MLMAMNQSDFAAEINRRAHNARVELKGLNRYKTRADRSVELLRHTVTHERTRASECVNVLRGIISLLDNASERGMTISPGFLAMHLRVAIRALGHNP